MIIRAHACFPTHTWYRPAAAWTPPPLNGVAYVTTTTDGGRTWDVKLDQAAGFADHRYQIPLTTANQFRIASNSKFFAAVALYQLQERGKLNVSRPVTDLFDATDYAKFGRPNATTWCPPLARQDSAEDFSRLDALRLFTAMDRIFIPAYCFALP